MSSIPHLMQAVIADAKGEPLRLVQVSTPRPGAGEVLVQVFASGVNPLDTKIFAGIAAHARHVGRSGAAAHMSIEGLGAQFVGRSEAVTDIVFDTAGGESLDACFAMVRRFGHVVSTLGWGNHSLAPLSFRAASYSGIFTLLPLLTGEGCAHHGAILAQATKLAELGGLVPALDPQRFTLNTVGDAYRAIEAGTARGKLVIDVH